MQVEWGQEGSRVPAQLGQRWARQDAWKAGRWGRQWTQVSTTLPVPDLTTSWQPGLSWLQPQEARPCWQFQPALPPVDLESKQKGVTRASPILLSVRQSGCPPPLALLTVLGGAPSPSRH